MHIQDFIRNNGLQEAVDKWHLKTNETEHYTQLNYDMIETPRGVPECDECRGLILDKSDWSIAARSFNRFYNENEGFSAKFDHTAGVLQEKVDGTLVMVWWDKYQEKLVCSTRGRIFADGGVGNAETSTFSGSVKTFSELFFDTAKKINPEFVTILSKELQGIPFFSLRNGGITLVFELYGPENRVLTPYEESGLVLIGGRFLSNTCEIAPETLDDISKVIGVRRPHTYRFTSTKDIHDLLGTLDPKDEGFVLTDYRFTIEGSIQRVKIKNPRYLALSKLVKAGDSEGMSVKHVISLIKLGDAEEVISYFPEYKDKILDLKQKFVTLGDVIDRDYHRIHHIENRKEFAIEAQKCQVSHGLYMLKDGRAKSGMDFLMTVKDDTLLSMLDKVCIK